MMRFTLKGADVMREKLRRLAKNFPDEKARALFQEANVEATEVKKRTPVRFGPLRASVHVEKPVRAVNRVSVRIVAGGQAAPYAIVVHENIYATHGVGQSKFLESVLFESVPHMAARIARRIDLNRALSDAPST